MLVNVSRQVRPDGLLVEPLIFRFFTYSRISLSLKLLCKGISGRSSTKSSSDLFLNILFKAKSNEAYPVFCWKISSNRWLRLILETNNLKNADEAKRLIQEANELKKIFSSIVEKSK